MEEKMEYYVTYRTGEDGPTSTCIARAMDEGTVRAWFEKRGDLTVSVTPKQHAPSWMGEGKAYVTVECPDAKPAGEDEADAQELITALEKRVERLVGEAEELARHLECADRALAQAREDSMQAVVAALLWGECGIDVAAACRIEGDLANGNPIGDAVTLCVGALQSVTLGSGAAQWLYEASAEKAVRGVGIAGRNGVWRYDLRMGGEGHGSKPEQGAAD